MRCRVTVTRVVRQYADIEVDKVDSVDAAAESVEDQLKFPDERERLLKGLTWFGTEDAVKAPADSLMVLTAKSID
jgi:hypothetical protein